MKRIHVVKLSGFIIAALLIASCAPKAKSADGSARSKPPRNSTVSTATGWTYENENFTGTNGYASSGFAAHENYRPQIPAGMVVIEGGTFMMGEKTDLITAQRDNLTRRVSVGSFYMDQYEVSNLNWREYVHWMEVVYGATAPRLVDKARPNVDKTSDPMTYNGTVKPGGMQKLSESVMEGYQEYVKFHPEADYSNLARDFMDYLMTDEAQKILKDNLQEIIESTGGFKITIDQMQELVQRVMEGYQKYAAEKGYTDPDKFGEYLAEYLQTEEAKEIMNAWQQEIFGDTVINITSDQLTKLARELAGGYSAYAAANGKADPTKMGEHFLNYLATADGKQRLMNGLSEVIDMDQLESQLSATMGSYMAKAMGTYTRAISDVLETQITSAMNQIVTQITEEIGNAMQAAMGNVGTQLQNMLGSSMKIDTDAFAKAFQMNMTEDDLKELMTSMTMSATASYDNNLQKLGYVDFANPSQISIYPTDFESKEKVVKILDSYNSRMEKEGKEEQIITYTDIVGTLMSSVTNIVDIISYVLIAFVAISLVVSSIMIGVITYISVLERKKEIGILRAIGASKRNVSQVFNAETVIIGLCAGLIGIGLSLLLLIPGNMIIHAVADNNKINAFLPVLPAIVLILLSIGLTLLGGIIPSRKAAKSDPVTALRTE